MCSTESAFPSSTLSQRKMDGVGGHKIEIEQPQRPIPRYYSATKVSTIPFKTHTIERYLGQYQTPDFSANSLKYLFILSISIKCP